MCCKTPKVSIALPVYNGEKYLREAIESVLAQTFKDFELIICDNASTDRTEKICREYAAQDPRIRYFRNEKNLGATKNFNHAFELSRGEYFKWIAADSAMMPECLEQCVDLLDGNQTVIVVCTKFIGVSEFDGTTTLIDSNFKFRSPITHRRLRDIFRRVVAVRGPLPIWGLMRSSVLKETCLLRPFIGSDSCFLVELVLKGEIDQIQEHLMLIRRHPDSYSDIKAKNDAVEGAAEAQFIDPESRNSFYLPHWRRLWEYFILVVHSKEKLGSKFIMAAFLVYPIATKWLKRLIKELFFAFGLKQHYGYLKRLGRQIRR